jgi:hypothetical protein
MGGPNTVDDRIKENARIVLETLGKEVTKEDIANYWQNEAIKQVEAFRARGGTGMWPKLDRNTIADQLIARIKNSNLVAQGNMDLCGPATMVRNIARDFPVRYAQAGIQLFELGQSKILALSLKPGPKVRSFTPPWNTPQADFMILASMRDAENWIFSPVGTFEGFASMTMPGTMESWFERAGYSDVREDTYLSYLTKPHWYVQLLQIKKMNALFDKGYKIALLIDSDMLEPEERTGHSRNPDHWVTLASKISSPDFGDEDSDIYFDVYTYGGIFSFGRGLVTEFTIENFCDHFYGYVAGRP